MGLGGVGDNFASRRRAEEIVIFFGQEGGATRCTQYFVSPCAIFSSSFIHALYVGGEGGFIYIFRYNITLYRGVLSYICLTRERRRGGFS